MAGANARYRRRLFLNLLMLVGAVLATVFGLFWLVWILFTTLAKGLSALTPALFTHMTPAPDSPGGLLNAFAGSSLIIALATVIGTPIGILAGTWLAQHGSERLATVIRFLNDLLLSLPSIIIGLFVYTLVVVPMGHFSGFAGAIALMLILLPVVIRTSDEMLRLVPTAMREAALALGAPAWVVMVKIGYRAASAGILTGVLLAVARISGETAPLLFTALSNQFWTVDLAKPMANVPVVTFQFAMSPYHDWQALAWAGALISTLSILALSIIARAILTRTASTS
jgi:phosphate transport system permease protein